MSDSLLRERNSIDERDERIEEVILTHPRPNPFLVFLGWLVRFGVGIALTTSFYTSVIVAGWLARRMRGVVVRQWWKRGSRYEPGESFEITGSTLGPGAPSARPWFFWRDRGMAWLHRPGSRGRPPGTLRLLSRFIRLPFLGLWENLIAGIRLIAGTYFLMGFGVVLIWLGWEFGWHNSFNKGYEQYSFGIMISLVGFGLFGLAMVYVPMAQVHVAVTQSVSAALDFRFLGKLIRVRMVQYTLLVMLTGLMSLPILVLRVAPRFFGQNDAWFETATDDQVQAFMQRYVLAQAAVVFLFLMVLRRWAASIYSGAVLEALARGDVTTKELHSEITEWLRKLDVEIEPRLKAHNAVTVTLEGGGWFGRRMAFGFIFVVWVAMLFGVMVGEFFNYHPVMGFLNHPLIGLPCPDQVPTGDYAQIR